MSKQSVIATITLELHDNGAMSIQGNIGDVKMALGMIDSAREAVASRMGRPSIIEPWGAGLEVPRDYLKADPSPLYPVIPRGDQ